MRSSLTLLLVIGLSTHVRAQQLEWLSHYGVPGQSSIPQGLLLAPDGDGHVYGARSFSGSPLNLDGNLLNSSVSQDLFVAKWDSAGHVIWADGVEGDGHPFSLGESVYDVWYDPATQELLVTGSNDTEMEFDHDTLVDSGVDLDTYMFVARYAADGECLWARRGTGAYVSGLTILLDTGSNAYLFGQAPYGATLHGQPDIVVPNGGYYAKYSSTGDLLEADRIITNGSVGGATWLSTDQIVLAGGFAASGDLLGTSVVVSNALGSGFLAVTDLLSTVDWLVPFHSTTGASVSDCVMASPNRIIVTGVFYDDLTLPTDTLHSPTGVLNGYIASFDLQGDLLWLTQLASPLYASHGGTLHVDDNGSIYVVGAFQGELNMGAVTLTATTGQQGFIARFDTMGVCQAAWDYGKVGNASGSIVPASDGIYFSCVYDSACTIAEYALDDPSGGQSFLMVAKIDSLNGFTGIPRAPMMGGELTIYANPNNGICTIDLPQSLQASDGLVLSVYDNTGLLVQRTPLEFNDQGLKLDVRAQAKGVYHVELSDGAQRYSGSIVFE
ncbi:MAG: T9SS type A sorting domain-containing protein [Flavobacteriales bacterium]